MSSDAGSRNLLSLVYVVALVLVVVVAVVIFATIYCILRAKKDEENLEIEESDHDAQQDDDNVIGSLSIGVSTYEARDQEPNKPNQKEEKQSMEVFIDNMLKQKPTRFSSQELQVFTRNYSTKLGSGGFGEVYKGEFPNGAKLAVKVLKSSIVDKRVKEQFMAEVGTIGRTYHRNLVRLYGFCFDPNTKALVYEYMENGSLDKVLYEKKHELKWEKLWEIAVGVAKGLEYLHHYSHERIIHYDIKPSNVLLDSEFCPKLGDFGVAKLCNRDSTHVTLSGARGTPGYAAPEVWIPFPVTCKCDVYSFGMTLFEIVGRRRNLDINLSDSQEWLPRQLWDKYDKGELEMVLADGGIEDTDMVKAKTMTTLAFWCVQYLPRDRPSMSHVVKIMEGEDQVTIPPNPFQPLIAKGEKTASFTESSTSSRNYDPTIDEEQNYTTIMNKDGMEYVATA